MNMIHHASLINDPFGDPGVYVAIKYRPESLLFDIGDLHRLPPRQLLKIDHIFVSHTHMDHFIGFDHLLRVALGRQRRIHLFGPPHFLRHVEDKLNAYTWNLVGNYTNDFELSVTEVHPELTISRRYRCRNAFRAEEESHCVFNGTLVQGDFFTVQAVFLDHGIPCLAFSLREHIRINIKKNILQEMGLPTGPWLLNLKDHIRRGAPDELPVRVWWRADSGRRDETIVPLGVLRERAVKITPGQKISYITDARYSEENARRILDLARGSELIFIEASFLDVDANMAARKCHLTARQSGVLARESGAKRMVTFHYSPKYKGLGNILAEEAMSAFRGEG